MGCGCHNEDRHSATHSGGHACTHSCGHKKARLKLQVTEDYQGLNEFFEKNELEISAEEPVSTDIVKAWSLTFFNDESAKIWGGIVLAMRQGNYIIDGIAVSKHYRNGKIGTMLLNKAINEIKMRGGDSLYLVARAPEFFEKNGFLEVPREEAPEFFECFTCPQYGKNCNPKVMKLDISSL